MTQRRTIPKPLTATSMIICFCSALVLPIASQAQTDYDAGVAAYEKSNFEAARTSFKAAVVQAPKNAYAYYYLALCQQRLGNYGEALKCYKSAIDSAPQGPCARLANLGLAALNAVGQNQNPNRTKLPEVDSSSNQQNGVLDQPPALSSIDFQEDPQRPSHLHISASINNRTIAANFDSGANRTTFSKNQLAAIGMQLPSTPPHYFIGEGTAAYTGVWNIPVTLRIGDITRQNYMIEVQELDGNWKSIGMDFFKGYAWSLDRGAHRIFFTSTAGARPAVGSNGTEVPFTKSGYDYIVKAELNDKPCDFVFDTGGVSVWLSRDQATRNGLTIPDDAEIVYVGERRVPCRVIYIQRLRLGPIDKSNVRACIYDKKDAMWGTGYPVLGPEFYKEYQYTIEPERGVIRFLRR